MEKTAAERGAGMQTGMQQQGSMQSQGSMRTGQQQAGVQGGQQQSEQELQSREECLKDRESGA